MSKRNQIQRRSYPSVLAWRCAKGLSQQQAAAVLGMTQASYARMELGQTCPRRAVLKRVLAETGVPLEVLVGVA